MPVLLRSQLDHARGSRATMTTRPSGLLRPPPHETQSYSHLPVGANIRRDSNQSAANVSRRTVVSVIEFPERPLPPLPPRKKGWLSKVKLGYHRLHLNNLLPLVFMMFYMVFGAVIFLWLEGAADSRRRAVQFDIYQRERELLLKRMEEIYNDRAAIQRVQRRLFLEEAVDYFHEQINVVFSNETDWSLTTALYYSGTVFTTIGYGDVACYTVWGRIMTVLYAIVGIPLMLITLNDLGKFLYRTINGVVKWSKCSDAHKSAPKKKQLDELEAVERGEHNAAIPAPPQRIEFQLSLDGDELLAVESTEDESPPLPLDEPGPPPRMPVTVAVGITVGWIFLCAALFKIWENDWTYAESCYFMFISLSTIGLGDVAVKRRDLMVICFVFVIIGLSMVSMCINVIQTALEDLYMKLLMKLLVEYQSRLAEGNDHVGASVGMMKLWGSNRTAKYLMPLLSKDKRMTAMAKVQEEAESKGIEIPPVFSDLDEESGMPKILSIDRKQSTTAVEEAVQHAEHGTTFIPPSPPLPTFPAVVFYDSDAQTDNPVFLEKIEQTESAEMHDSGIGTDIRFADYLCTAVQCDERDTISETTQTTRVELSDSEVMTCCQPSSESSMQTDCVITKEQQLQTHLVDYLECYSQTDSPRYACEAVQTPVTEFADDEVQTDEVCSRRRSGWAKDRRRSADPSMPTAWSKISEAKESTSSEESLDWDPIDGMHAEKQRPVRDLARFFDKRLRGKNSE